MFAKQIYASIKVICQYWVEKDITKTEASVPLIKLSFHQLYRTGKVQEQLSQAIKKYPITIKEKRWTDSSASLQKLSCCLPTIT